MAALRLAFAHEGRQVDLASVQLVDGIAPTPPMSRRGIGGVRLELLDGNGETLYVRPLIDPFGETPEVPSDDPYRPIRRAVVDNPSGRFEVLTPAVPGAVEVVLLEGRVEGGERFSDEGRDTSETIARFRLLGGAQKKDA